MTDNCAILILSCDKYSDLWRPFFDGFWKHWSDCPYKVYLGSNEVQPPPEIKAVPLLSGKDVDWSSSLMNLLNQITEEYIMVWIEDAFISSPINTKEIKSAFEFLSRTEAKQIHMKPVPKPDIKINDVFGGYNRGCPYRVTVVGFWKRTALLRILLPGENAWNFEIMGSYRTAYEDGYYCLNKPLFSYVHMVEKGNWIKEGVEYCQKNNFQIKTAIRKMQVTKIIPQVKQLYFDFVLSLPWSARVKMMSILRKLFISY